VADGSDMAVAVVGLSSTEVCGVRDHATVLAGELESRGLDVNMLWLNRGEGAVGQEWREVRAYAEALTRKLREERSQAVILHYSVFSYAHRGVPIYVHPVMAALRRSGLPVLSVVHEAVYPWTLGGARGKVWAATQRLALIEHLRASSALLVTAEFRAQWLSSRFWLPRRPIAVAPVFSNLPAPHAEARDGDALGLFGYAYEGADAPLVLDALSLLRQRRPDTSLRLIGAPGPGSAAGKVWMREARARGVEQAISFSGKLAPQELSDALAACAALLSIPAAGPSSRKGSLAGSLASGAPVVALDGPLRWDELTSERALLISARDASSLAGALAGLLEDPQAARRQGERGREFAATRMGVARTADAALSLLAPLVRG
jgi:glycosyltransferase involved in cell wall biosynthesis